MPIYVSSSTSKMKTYESSFPRVSRGNRKWNTVMKTSLYNHNILKKVKKKEQSTGSFHSCTIAYASTLSKVHWGHDKWGRARKTMPQRSRAMLQRKLKYTTHSPKFIPVAKKVNCFMGVQEEVLDVWQNVAALIVKYMRALEILTSIAGTSNQYPPWLRVSNSSKNERLHERLQH